MRVYFQNQESLLGPDHVSVLTRLESKCLALEFLRQFSAFESSQTSAFRGSLSVGVCFRQFVKFGAFAQLLKESVGFGFGLRNHGRILRLLLSLFRVFV